MARLTEFHRQHKEMSFYSFNLLEDKTLLAAETLLKKTLLSKTFLILIYSLNNLPHWFKLSEMQMNTSITMLEFSNNASENISSNSQKKYHATNCVAGP
jgi:hypothetical protein